MIYVDFPDAHSIETTSSLHDFFLPAATTWYKTASYNKLTLTVSTNVNTGFLRMPATSDSYGWARGLTSETHYKYIQDALDAYVAAGGNLTPVDVLYIVPTAAATQISFSPTYMGPVSPRTGGSPVVAKRCVTIGMDAYNYWGYKVINHETGHTMGLSDMYPFSGGPTGQYVGGWDIMGLISGPSPDYFGWDKWRLGWIDDTNVTCVSTTGTTTHTLSPLETAAVSGAVKTVVVKKSSTYALVAEARTNKGVDSGACAQGVLIYRVYTNIATGNGPFQVIDAKPSSGGCAGDELNDAVLTLAGVKTLTVDGVTFTLTSVSGANYKITVKV